MGFYQLFKCLLLFGVLISVAQANRTVETTESLPSPTTTLPSSTSTEPSSTLPLNGEEEDDEGDESIPSIDRKSRERWSIEGGEEESSKGETVKENEDDEEEDEEDEEEETCNEGRLSAFVRQVDRDAYHPDDYETLQEQLRTVGPYGHFHSFNDTLANVRRDVAYVEKLMANKDLQDSVKYLGSVLSDVAFEAKLSAQCTADIMAIGQGLLAGQGWAIRFPDSFGVAFSNLLHGQWSSYGQYDQCLAIQSPAQESGRTLTPRYCLLHFADITPPLAALRPGDDARFRAESYYEQYILRPMASVGLGKYVPYDLATYLLQAVQITDYNTYDNGLCLPASCSGQEIANVINEVIYPLAQVAVTIPEEHCQLPPHLRKVTLDSHQKVAVLIFACIISWVLICTFIHLCFTLRTSKTVSLLPVDYRSFDPSNNNGNGNGNGKTEENHQETILEVAPAGVPPYLRLIFAFSMIENSRQLMAISSTRYASLDTLRVLLSLLIFPINSFGLYQIHNPQLFRNVDGLTRNEMLASNGHWLSRMPGLWFDGLVFIFAVLTIFQQFRLLDRSAGQFSYFSYVCRRWFRLSFPLFGTILLLYLLPLSGDGPMWFYTRQFISAPCKRVDSLLSTFLYYSNWNDHLNDYVPKSTLSICNTETWFLSSFTQLYLLAPLLFLPLYFAPKVGVTLTLGAIALAPLATAAPRLLTGYPSYMEVTKFTQFIYIARAHAHSHMNPLLYVNSLTVGLLTGYLIKCKPNLRLGGPLGESALWFFSASSVVYIAIWHQEFQIENVDHSSVSVIGWFIYSKFTWSLFLGLTAYLTCTGRPNWLTSLLSRPALLPIAKLSNCVYLLRILVIFYHKTTARFTHDWNLYSHFPYILAHFLLTLLFAYFLHCLFEAPILRIGTLLEGPETNVETLQRWEHCKREHLPEKEDHPEKKKKTDEEKAQVCP